MKGLAWGYDFSQMSIGPVLLLLRRCSRTLLALFRGPVRDVVLFDDYCVDEVTAVQTDVPFVSGLEMRLNRVGVFLVPPEDPTELLFY